MLTVTIVCARCTLANHVSERFCSDCGLPMGALQPDAEAAYDALEPYEAPEPADPDVARLDHRFRQADAATTPIPRAAAGRSSSRCGSIASRRSMSGRREPTPRDGRSSAWSRSAGRSTTAIAAPCSSSTRASSRDISPSGCLRGEEYFVVIENLAVDMLNSIDAARLVRRVAEVADGLEDRLSRGRDLY